VPLAFSWVAGKTEFRLSEFVHSLTHSLDLRKPDLHRRSGFIIRPSVEWPTAPLQMDEIENSYNEVTYRSGCIAATRLDNLFILGKLAGLAPRPVNGCRVLEIGCASGGNLVPMAAMFPESSFVGIDLSSKQVDQAQELIRNAGLTNIRIVQEDILDFQDSSKFDYIIAHGIYSWVPFKVRDRMLGLFRQYLAPAGVGYVCFNALPGFHLNRITRDMMRYHTRRAASVQERTASAREILKIIASALPLLRSPYLDAMRAVSAEVQGRADWFLAHDDLEEVCEPVYLRDFVEHSQSHGLAYLSGARSLSNLARLLEPELKQQLLGFSNGPVELEQYCDFIYGTRYRDAILCLQTSVRSERESWRAVQHMHFAAILYK
jgi:SAM-dependent methyltransferase